ncbi:MAG: asparagine synthetase B, partial [Clostridia bacterium]|nr:asparagine synthetase B [Clostridia bacterium]
MLRDSTSPILKVVDANVIRQMIDSELPAAGLPWFGQLMSGPQMLAYLWQVNEWMRTRRVDIVI